MPVERPLFIQVLDGRPVPLRIRRDGGISEIKGDPFMRGLVGDPRYKAFLKKLKLPE